MRYTITRYNSCNPDIMDLRIVDLPGEQEYLRGEKILFDDNVWEISGKSITIDKLSVPRLSKDIGERQVEAIKRIRESCVKYD